MSESNEKSFVPIDYGPHKLPKWLTQEPIGRHNRYQPRHHHHHHQQNQDKPWKTTEIHQINRETSRINLEKSNINPSAPTNSFLLSNPTVFHNLSSNLFEIQQFLRHQSVPPPIMRERGYCCKCSKRLVEYWDGQWNMNQNRHPSEHFFTSSSSSTHPHLLICSSCVYKQQQQPKTIVNEIQKNAIQKNAIEEYDPEFPAII
jgi:hypothetical protein